MNIKTEKEKKNGCGFRPLFRFSMRLSTHSTHARHTPALTRPGLATSLAFRPGHPAARRRAATVVAAASKAPAAAVAAGATLSKLAQAAAAATAPLGRIVVIGDGGLLTAGLLGLLKAGALEVVLGELLARIRSTLFFFLSLSLSPDPPSSLSTPGRAPATRPCPANSPHETPHTHISPRSLPPFSPLLTQPSPTPTPPPPTLPSSASPRS